MSNQTILSVILPIYNVADYLPACIDSLLQTEGSDMLEIILVDDGSTDNSGKTADNYSAKYQNIHSVHKQNGGLSDARNYGLERANGKYVFFCDPDDSIIPEAFATVIKTISETDADVVMWDGQVTSGNEQVNTSDLEKLLVHTGLKTDGTVMSGTQVLADQIMAHNNYSMTAWLMACKREFLNGNNLVFEKGLIHEDELWTPQVLLSASTAIYVPVKAYNYHIRNNSITQSKSIDKNKHANAYIHILNTLAEYYRSSVTGKDTLDILMAKWSFDYMVRMADYDFDKADDVNLVPKKDICRSSHGFKNKIKAMLLRIFGISGFCSFMRLIHGNNRS